MAVGTDICEFLVVYTMCTGSSGGLATRYIMISDNGRDMTIGEGILSVLTTFHTVIYAQVHMNVLLF